MVLHGVGEASPQSIPVKSISRHSPIIPGIRETSRAGEALIVIKKDPIVLDISELVWIEEELGRANVSATRPFVSNIQIGGESTFIITGGKLGSVNFAALVVE